MADTSTARGAWAGVRAVLVLGVLPVAIGVLTTRLPDWWPVWAAVAVLAVVIAAYRTHNAPMSRLRSSPIGYLAAGSLLTGFLITLPLAAQHERNPLLVLLPALLLWASALTALTPVLTAVSGLATSSLAVGDASFLLGVAALRDGDRLGGLALLLLGPAALLFGVALLRDGDRLFGVTALLSTVATLLFGVALLRDGDRLGGVALLLFGAALLLAMAALLRDDYGLCGMTLLLAGAPMLLLGATGLRDGDRLGGVAALLFGAVPLVVGVAALVGAREMVPCDDGTGTRLVRTGFAWQQLQRWATTARTPPATARPDGLPPDHHTNESATEQGQLD